MRTLLYIVNFFANSGWPCTTLHVENDGDILLSFSGPFLLYTYLAGLIDIFEKYFNSLLCVSCMGVTS